LFNSLEEKYRKQQVQGGVRKVQKSSKDEMQGRLGSYAKFEACRIHPTVNTARVLIRDEIFC
jgi:hypothetical protein